MIQSCLFYYSSYFSSNVFILEDNKKYNKRNVWWPAAHNIFIKLFTTQIKVVFFLFSQCFQFCITILQHKMLFSIFTSCSSNVFILEYTRNIINRGYLFVLSGYGIYLIEKWYNFKISLRNIFHIHSKQTNFLFILW